MDDTVIVECNLYIDTEDDKKVEEVLNTLTVLEFEIDYDYEMLVPTEWSFKWRKAVDIDLMKLSKVAEGDISFRDDEGNIWKFILEEKRLRFYMAEIKYHEKYVLEIPEDLLEKGYITSDRLILFESAGFLSIFDRKKSEVYEVRDPDWFETVDLFKKHIEGEASVEQVLSKCTKYSNGYKVPEAVKNRLEKILHELN